MKEEDVHLNLLSRYVSNEISLNEVEGLLQWLSEDPEREDMLRDFQETWDISKSYPENFKVDTPAAWVKLRNTIREEEPPQKVNLDALLKWAALTALILIILFGAILGFKYLSGS